MPSPWAGGFPSNQQGGSDLPMNLLGSLMNSGGSGNMANLASSLVAQALQNKPGGMIIGGNHFGPSSMGQGPSGPPRGGGYMDRGRDDYRVRIWLILTLAGVPTSFHEKNLQFFLWNQSGKQSKKANQKCFHDFLTEIILKNFQIKVFAKYFHRSKITIFKEFCLF